MKQEGSVIESYSTKEGVDESFRMSLPLIWANEPFSRGFGWECLKYFPKSFAAGQRRHSLTAKSAWRALPSPPSIHLLNIFREKKYCFGEKKRLTWSALNVLNKDHTSLSEKCLRLRKPQPIKYLDFLFKSGKTILYSRSRKTFHPVSTLPEWCHAPIIFYCFLPGWE